MREITYEEMSEVGGGIAWGPIIGAALAVNYIDDFLDGALAGLQAN